MQQNKKIKLLYVVNGRIPNTRANSIQIVNTCEAIGATGTELTLVTPMFFGPKNALSKQYDIEQTFTHVKILALDIPHFPLQFFVRSWTFFLSVNMYLFFVLIKTFFTGKKMVVYARGEVVFSLLPLSYLVPVFFETHQIRNYESLYQVVLRRVKGIVVITDRLKKKFVEEYGIKKDKIVVARDSVNLQKFSDVVADKVIWVKHGIRTDKKIVVYTGTLSSEKGVDTLAASAEYVGENTQIVFIGGNQSHAEAFKEKYKASNNIFVLGYVEHEYIPKYVAAADVLVLPDLFTDTYANLYTSPMKLFEYMASGRIIVASDVPSLREVLTDDTAIFFESGDAKALASKIEEALKSYHVAQKNGRNAQEVVSDFTWSKRGERVLNHIAECIS